MGLLMRFRMARAAKCYARTLGPALARTYGSSQWYSVEQIQMAVWKLGLDKRFIGLGYAEFLPPREFWTRWRKLPIRVDYDSGRALLARYKRPASSPDWEGPQKEEAPIDPRSAHSPGV